MASIVVDADAPREEWMDARSEGVTASEVHEIATGSRKAWAAVLDRKLNGSTFKGNRHTRRGHERESLLLDYAKELRRSAEPNGALWAAESNSRHLATPDGIGDGFVIEVKSHDFGHVLGPIPPAHRSQMQWQMYVMGADEALYIREVMDEDGQGSLDDPETITVARDDDYIAWLVSRADAFLDWWDNDCPPTDDMDEETAAVLEEWVQAKRELEPIAKREAAARKKLTALMKKRPNSKFGVQLQGEHGGAQLASAAWKRETDWGRLNELERVEHHKLKMLAEAAAERLKFFEEKMDRWYGRDVLTGSQALRLAGGER